MVEEDPQLDTENIPDRWNIVQDPYNQNEDVYLLEYPTDPAGDPSSTIVVEPPNSERAEYANDRWTVEVQDQDADGASMGYLNPLALVEHFDDLTEAYERVVELSNEYPINAGESVDESPTADEGEDTKVAPEGEEGDVR